jgi:hypothetical protein
MTTGRLAASTQTSCHHRQYLQLCTDLSSKSRRALLEAKPLVSHVLPLPPPPPPPLLLLLLLQVSLD